MKKHSILLLTIFSCFLVISSHSIEANPDDIFIEFSWDFGTSETVLPCSPLCVSLQVDATNTGSEVDIYIIAVLGSKNYYLPSWKSKPEVFKRMKIEESTFILPVVDCVEMDKFFNSFDVTFHAAAVYSKTFDIASNVLSDKVHFVGQPILDDKFPLVDTYMSSMVEYYNVIGASIAVFSSCETLYTAGYGLKKWGYEGEITPKTQFRIGSVSKTVATTAIMKFVEDGRLDLYEPVLDYVPYFHLYYKFAPEEITSHQCLSHSAGLPDYLDFNGDTDSEALSRWFKTYGDYIPLWSPPGRLYNYATLGYNLVGLAIEEIDDTPFSDIMQKLIFDPLGMMDTTYNPSEVLEREDYATGHEVYYGGSCLYYEPDENYSSNCNPGGMVYSNVEDMSKFGTMLLSKGGDVLTPESVALMSSPLVPTNQTPDDYYGYGLYQDTADPLGGIEHGGSLPGYLTSFKFYPEKNLGLIVVINSKNISPSYLLNDTVEILLNYNPPPPPDYSTSPETWEKYTGYYVDPYEWGRINVYQDSEKRLWAEFIDFEELGYEDGPVELFQVAQDYFYFESNAYKTNLGVTFWLDDNEQGEYFATRAGIAKRSFDTSLIENNMTPYILKGRVPDKLRPLPDLMPFN